MKASSSSAGLGFWMTRVLRECDAAGRELAVDPVHDLRVALRRCRSMADGIMAIDPDPAWKDMKRAGKQLFASLGALRDIQVMQEWASTLGSPDDAPRRNLLQVLTEREQNAKADAGEALAQFDRRQWRRWIAHLGSRSARLKPGSVVYQHLALERWTEGYALHRKAMRSRTPHALHSLRIGIKRFRYIVENFLPEHHAQLKDGLKGAQDVLGEIHDLDVLWMTMLEGGTFSADDDEAHWRQIIETEKEQRIERYMSSTAEPESLWRVWRDTLPKGRDAELAGMQRIRLWAAYRNGNLHHSRHVARLGLQLYDGLIQAGAWKSAGERERKALYIASILHQVGVSSSRENSHKAAYRLVRKMKPLLGWGPRTWQIIAAVVRFYAGGLPARGQKAWDRLPLSDKRTVKFLAAVLRLSEAFDRDHSSRISGLRVERSHGLIRIRACGYLPSHAGAMHVSRARHALEIVCKSPVYIQPQSRQALKRAS